MSKLRVDGGLSTRRACSKGRFSASLACLQSSMFSISFMHLQAPRAMELFAPVPIVCLYFKYLCPSRMFEASLNLASLCGLALLLWWLLAVPAACFQLWFILTRRADTSPTIVVKSLLAASVGVGRIVGLPITGFILFSQGWRLDPILQFAVIVLCVLLFAESLASVASDFAQWRRRLGRAVAVISVDQQPEDNS